MNENLFQNRFLNMINYGDLSVTRISTGGTTNSVRAVLMGGQNASGNASNTIDFGINEILFHGKYAENQGEERYLMDFRHVISSIVLKKQFSDYIVLKGQLNHFLRTHDSEVINSNEISNDQDKENNVSFAMTVEFLL
mgnify:CR=1 FL=1